MGLNKKEIFKASLIIIIVLGLIIAWLTFGEGGFIHLLRKDKERQVYIEKIRKLEEANRELIEQIDRLREDKDYIESMARRELGLVRENELIYRFGKEQDDGEKINGKP